jgi:hypothetical protein
LQESVDAVDRRARANPGLSGRRARLPRRRQTSRPADQLGEPCRPRSGRSPHGLRGGAPAGYRAEAAGTSRCSRRRTPTSCSALATGRPCGSGARSSSATATRTRSGRGSKAGRRSCSAEVPPVWSRSMPGEGQPLAARDRETLRRRWHASRPGTAASARVTSRSSTSATTTSMAGSISRHPGPPTLA